MLLYFQVLWVLFSLCALHEVSLKKAWTETLLLSCKHDSVPVKTWDWEELPTALINLSGGFVANRVIQCDALYRAPKLLYFSACQYFRSSRREEKTQRKNRNKEISHVDGINTGSNVGG